MIIKSYTVEAGDTLSGIAHKLYGEATMYSEIARVNKLPDPNHIFVGQVLTLPRPVNDPSHLVVPVIPTQESLDAIANLFHPGFCDGRMEYAIYAAAIGAEDQYNHVMGRQ